MSAAVNMHEAKTHLSRLVERAAAGEIIVIAKAGKPVAKLTAIDVSSTKPISRFGILKGQFVSPDNFDTMAQDEIVAMFEGKD